MIDHSAIVELTKDQYTTDLINKAKKIQLLAFDVDGVLTDGGLYYDHQGNESKKFHAQDGHGIKIIQSIGIQTMIISGRKSPCVDKRGNELGIDTILQGSRDKLKSFHEQDVQLKADEIYFFKTGFELGTMTDRPTYSRSSMSTVSSPTKQISSALN